MIWYKDDDGSVKYVIPKTETDEELVLPPQNGEGSYDPWATSGCNAFIHAYMVMIKEEETLSPKKTCEVFDKICKDYPEAVKCSNAYVGSELSKIFEAFYERFGLKGSGSQIGYAEDDLVPRYWNGEEIPDDKWDFGRLELKNNSENYSQHFVLTDKNWDTIADPWSEEEGGPLDTGKVQRRHVYRVWRES